MAGALDRGDRTGLAANVAGAVAACAPLNGAIFGLGSEATERLYADAHGPPGWFIGTVWMLLYAAMGMAWWRLAARGGADVDVGRRGAALS